MILAAILATVGLLRLASDLLTDVDPGWASLLGGSARGRICYRRLCSLG